MNNKKAFTLVEILVVISIIALLMGVLMPVLLAARKSSKKMLCATNLKQISLAINLYAEDYDGNIIKAGEMPNTKIDDQFLGLWHIALLPYVSGIYSGDDIFEEDYSKLWFCPEDKDPYPLGYKNSSPMNWTSYALNGYSQDAIKLGPAGGYKFTDVSHPSECMLMGETSYASQFYDLDSEKTKEFAIADDEPISVCIIDPIDSNAIHIPIDGHHRMTTGFYHSNSMNLLFVDGHIGNIKGQIVPTDDRYYPTNYRDEDYAFWPNLSLPTADESSLFWGPGY